MSDAAAALPAGPLPAALLFDMDGLLVDTERTWFAVETEIMASLGAPWGDEHQAALVGGPLEKSVQYMLDHADRPDVAPDQLAQALLEGIERLAVPLEELVEQASSRRVGQRLEHEIVVHIAKICDRMVTCQPSRERRRHVRVDP